MATDCACAERSLRPGRLYTVRMQLDGRAGAILHEVVRCINSRGGGRVDLTSSSAHLGNNFRIVLAAHALSLGLRKALYLDCDTRVHAPLGPLFAAADDAPLVVANQSATSHDWGFTFWTYNSRNPRNDAQLRARRRQFGFVDVGTQTFNAGVLMMNTRQWCEARLTQRLLSVARYHADSAPLFGPSGNQPLLELAVVGHAHRVEPAWNCRVHRADPRSCKISHLVARSRMQQERKPHAILVRSSGVDAEAIFGRRQ